MKRFFWKQFSRQILMGSLLLMGMMAVVSCKDDYTYDDKEPDWLGSSVYGYLNDNGSFKYYTRLINDVGYREVLERTGSKTLFVSKDDAFEEFFKSNAWGVSNYDELTLSQKKLILNFGMIDNAYLIETLCNYYSGSLLEGQSMRRATAISIYDSLPFESGSQMPATEHWDKFRAKGLYLLNDGTSWPMVYFLQKQLDFNKISDEDFRLMTGATRTMNDAHIFNCKVIDRDVVCKNGYVHVLERVLVPPTNMAQYLREDSETQTFSSLLERFSGAYYNAEATVDYKKINSSFTDSIYIKAYFAPQNRGGATRYPSGLSVNSEHLLPFSPNWNSYVTEAGALQADMAAMFAPTDQALDDYFNSGSGVILKNRYGSWDKVPNDILVLLLKRHMRESLIESIPSRFAKMQDSENSPIPVDMSQIVGSYVGLNGIVYKTNKVYPPDDYESVYGPVLFSEKTTVFNWAIRENDFRFYLNSLVSKYSFFVPTDEYFNNYIEPLAFSKTLSAALKFRYNSTTGYMNATVYKYDKLTNTVGDSVTMLSSSDPTEKTFILNRLLDMLDSHIVVGGVESGDGYYLTKGGNAVKVNGSGADMQIVGGGDIEQGVVTRVNDVYNQKNGKTYFIDKPIQTPMRSVYKILSTTPEFSEFFKLLDGFTKGSTWEIFLKPTGTKVSYGIDYNIKFFNTFNYTVYVPTNDKILEAINQGIIVPWQSTGSVVGILDMTDKVEMDAAVEKLGRFLRYHFQDNSVFISGNTKSDTYLTATIKKDDLPTQFRTYKNKYYKLGVALSGDNLILSTENYGHANVVKDNGLYNIMTRDYIFKDTPLKYKEIDGSVIGSASLGYSASTISTSSTAVIHQIDNILRFE